jgi:anhydro-N-acetylmuramic acid kinase
MIYKVIGVQCGKPGEGSGIGYVELQFTSGKWEYSNFIKEVVDYSAYWQSHLPGIEKISLAEYQSLNKEFGKYLAEIIKAFITKNALEFRVQLIALKGFSLFEETVNYCEMGDPAAIASATEINVVADFTGINISLGGNGNYGDAAAAELLPEAGIEIQLALMAVLRWREENNFIATKTGAIKNSIGGAVWTGQEA